MWPFKRKPKTYQPSVGKKIPAGDWEECKPTATVADRKAELEAQGYKDHGEITLSDGSKVRVMAKEPNT